MDNALARVAALTTMTATDLVILIVSLSVLSLAWFGDYIWLRLFDKERHLYRAADRRCFGSQSGCHWFTPRSDDVIDGYIDACRHCGALRKGSVWDYI